MATIIVMSDRSMRLAFDATLSERHTFKNAVTRFPVERGTNRTTTIADNIRPEPNAISISGIVADSPIAIGGDALDVSADRLGAAVFLLEQMRNEVVEIVTAVKTHRNMAIEGITVTREQNTGRALSASIDLTEVIAANAVDLDLPAPAAPSGTATKKVGKKDPLPTTTQPEKAQSFLRQALGSAAKIAGADVDFARALR